MARYVEDRTIEVTDRGYLLRFGFDLEINEVLRGAGGWFDRQEGAWVLRASSASKMVVEDLIVNYDFEIC